jgi:hypothetical protein
LLGLPAQTRQASQMGVVHQAACTGLSDAECCEWTVREASFKVTREQMPKASARAVRLVCADKQQAPTRAVCKSIALTRGFCAREADLLCEANTTRKLCQKGKACADCVAKLEKLGYQQAHWACRAATYAAEQEPEVTTVIVVEEESGYKGSEDSTRTVIKRRRKLR